MLPEGADEELNEHLRSACRMMPWIVGGLDIGPEIPGRTRAQDRRPSTRPTGVAEASMASEFRAAAAEMEERAPAPGRAVRPERR